MLQLNIFTKGNQVETLSEFLLENEAQAVTFLDAADQPLFQFQPHEIHLWQKMIVTALFTNEITLNKLLPLLIQQFPEIRYQVEKIPDQDWVIKTQSNFKPLKFGKKLWICPPWNKITNPNKVVVTLNPGIAFGTGTHPTTALCLEWLEQNIHGGEILIDYGCGSGILAIAALKLGAKEVWAIDHDPQALESTQTNAELNQISIDRLHIMTPEALENVKADMLIANILALPLIELKEKFINLLKNKAKIALSGILEDQAPEILAAYQEKFKMSIPRFKQEWALLEGQL